MFSLNKLQNDMESFMKMKKIVKIGNRTFTWDTILTKSWVEHKQSPRNEFLLTAITIVGSREF